MGDKGKQKISANRILADIRSGMTDVVLKQKYGLSDKGLDSVYDKLRRAGYLSETEVLDRSNGKPIQDRESRKSSPGLQWKCPSCHTTHASEHDECPACGIVAAKFKARQEGERSPAEAFAHISYTKSSSSGLRMAVVAVVAILIAGGTFAVWVKLMAEPEPQTGPFRVAGGRHTAPNDVNKNALAIKGRTSVEDLEVDLQPLAELDFKSKAEVYSLRSGAVSRYPQLVMGNYQPSHAVFDQIGMDCRGGVCWGRIVTVRECRVLRGRRYTPFPL